MLERRAKDFAEAVWIAATRIGRLAPPIADAIIPVLFPVTNRAARDEGASRMFRNGVIEAVARVLRSVKNPDENGDFASLSTEFHPLVEKLKSGAYYVVALGEYVPIADLIAHPPHLDDARRYIRSKGEECLRVADMLDQLYKAVTASAPGE